jgi:hypothetical protein
MAARQWIDDRDDDGTTDPPNHGKRTDEVGRFFEWCARLDRDVSVSKLGDLYQEWTERRDAGQQADLQGWDDE